jgi:hypothetical protein
MTKMKNQSNTMQFLFLLVSLFILSCKKDNPVNAQASSVSPPSCHEVVHDSIILPKLLGTWHWAESNGGLFNIHETPVTCNCTRKIIFKDDCSYEEYYNDTLSRARAFYLGWQNENGECGGDSALAIFIYLKNNNDLEAVQFVCNIGENELHLVEGNSDPMGSIYIK